MRTWRLAICIGFLVLSTIGMSAQDTTCENFQVETIACNDPPHNACSSRTSLNNVIVGYNSGGCNHIETEPLTCPNVSRNKLLQRLGPQPLLHSVLWLRW